MAQVIGPRQRSHLVSVDALNDINRHGTLGTKVGLRLSETAADAASPFVENDAWLGVISARYHMVNNWDALTDLTRDDRGLFINLLAQF